MASIRQQTSDKELNWQEMTRVNPKSFDCIVKPAASELRSEVTTNRKVVR